MIILNPLKMKSLIMTLSLCLILCCGMFSKSKASQPYDVGVFYMPFWEYNIPNDPLSGHWGFINTYDTYLVNKGLASKARIPQNIYWPSSVWYDETMTSVNEKHMELMSTHGIDFVVYDSFFQYNYEFGGFYAPYYSGAMKNLILPGFNNHGVKLAIMWADKFLNLVDNGKCDLFLKQGGGLDSLFGRDWKKYIKHDNYKKINNKPVFYIFYPTTSGTPPTQTSPGIPHTNTIEGLCGMCATHPFFSSADPESNFINSQKTKVLLNRIEQIVGESLYFVAVLTTDVKRIDSASDTHNIDNYNDKWNWLKLHPEEAGYDAITSYGYKYFDSEDAYTVTLNEACSQDINKRNWLNWAYNYVKMQEVHIRFYDYIKTVSASTVDYQVPVSSGWNRGPMNMDEVARGDTAGGKNKFAEDCNLYSRDPLDGAESNPSSFRQSLVNAKAFIDANEVKTKKTVMICCWNEFGEGTYIQPTYTWGTQYLDQVLDVFGPTDYAMANPLMTMANTVKPLAIEPAGDYTTYVYPNPSSTVSNISFYVKNAGQVDIRAVDLNGNQLEQLMQQKLDAGRHKVSWNVSFLKRGIYAVRITINGKTDVRKVMVN